MFAFPSHGIPPVGGGRYPSTSRRVACQEMDGGAVIYTKRRFLGLKQYGEKSLCETVAVLPPFHIYAERDKRAVFGRPYLACWD